MMRRPRLTLEYWPVRENSRPAITLQRTPRPGCPDCDGSGYIAWDIHASDERACHCAPEEPLATLPLPRIVRRAVYHYWTRERRDIRTCWFCGADNDYSVLTSCAFCNHYLEP